MPHETDVERLGHSWLTSIVGLVGFCAAVGGLMLLTSDLTTIKGIAKLIGGLALWSFAVWVVVKWLRS